MTNDFDSFLAAFFAAPRVSAFCKSGDLFHNLARRLAANVLQPGTGSVALQLFTDLVKIPPDALVTFLSADSLSSAL